MRTMSALLLREMGSTYGQSPGGYVWAILQPVGMIMILSLAFSMLLRSPSLGTSFILFYATGFLPFDTYGTIGNKTMQALRYSRPLLAYPRVTWMDAILARFLLNVLTTLTVSAIVMTGILMVERTRVILDIVFIAQGYSIAILVGLGVGIMNCLLSGLYPVWSVVWSIINRPMFLASGVLYIFEDLPRSIQNILWWNPLFHATGLVRKGFYPTYDAVYASATYGIGFGLFFICIGMVLLRANYQRILEK